MVKLQSFTNSLFKNQPALSKYFCNLKDRGLAPQITLQNHWKSSSMSSLNCRCNLCLEKYHFEI